MKKPSRKFLSWSAAAFVAIALFYLWVSHGNPSELAVSATEGRTPQLVEPESETFPSVGIVSPVGWAAQEAPVPAKGLVVSRFAEGLVHPRTMLTLPNGDVLVAETAPPPRNDGGLTGFFAKLLMEKSGSAVESPNRIVLLRDTDGDGKAEQRLTLRSKGLVSPSGMAWRDGKLYIANHDAVLAFDYTPGANELVGEPKKLMNPKGGGHWMRNLLLSPDGKKLYVAVGSLSNIGENGMAEEEGRAAIWEINLGTGSRRQFAAGMRNPNGMAWNPSTGELWATVQERDMLGPDLVPDYLTNVPIGAQYGWPWVYWKDIEDWRVTDPMPAYLTEYARKPEYALGAHAAALGLLFSSGGNIMGENYANGAFVARHGSWNRKPLSGYDVVFVSFDARGNPQGKVQPLLTGFLTGSNNETRGRPVWLAWDKLGALLVSDDTGGVIWRVHAPGASPSLAPKAVVEKPMPRLKSLEGMSEAEFTASFRPDADQ